MTVRIRPANRADLPRLTEIYNHYVIHTPVTFDVEPYTVERRAAWFEQFALTGRYRLVVAEEDGLVLGYAGTTRFRPKAAYDTTVETTVYSSHEVWAKELAEKFMQDCLRRWPAKTSIALLAVHAPKRWFSQAP